MNDSISKSGFYRFLEEVNKIERVSSLSLLVGIILIIPMFLTFLRNFKYNDNHLNWLNHDYSKNLLMCTEENSIFMTEGGDNQVFGSLYFTYAEKLRPDISPYDQKGNIFKRIYGDMRYIDPITLNRRMQLVDTHLFCGEEPFYEDIRDRKDPYFVPYWQGIRPVYLTWERPDPWTLDMTYFQDNKRKLPEWYLKKLGLGEFYYKRYGIMYKVQNIKYKLVDYLEIKKRISLSEAEKLFAEWLHKKVDSKFTMEKVSELTKEGLVKLQNNIIEFVKMYPPPHNEDYLANMLFRWKNIPNAKYLDVLSREIIVNYGYMLGEIYRNNVEELLKLKKEEKDPEVIKNIENKIKENWQKAKEYYEEAITYGYDSLSVLHNIGLVYMRNEIEDLSEKARMLFRNGLKYYPNSFGTYSVMFAFLITDSFKHPENEEKNLEEFEKYMNQLKRVLLRYRSSQGDYKKHPIWQRFEGLERFYDNMKLFPTSQLEKAVESAEIQISKASFDVKLLQTITTVLYIRGLNFSYQPYIDKADYFMKRIMDVYGKDRGVLEWAFVLYLQTQRIKEAYNIGKSFLAKGFEFSDPMYYYYFGVISFQENDKNSARASLNKFVTTVSGDRKKLIQLRNFVEEANKLLSIIK